MLNKIISHVFNAIEQGSLAYVRTALPIHFDIQEWTHKKAGLPPYSYHMKVEWTAAAVTLYSRWCWHAEQAVLGNVPLPESLELMAKEYAAYFERVFNLALKDLAQEKAPETKRESWPPVHATN